MDSIYIIQLNFYGLSNVVSVALSKTDAGRLYNGMEYLNMGKITHIYEHIPSTKN